MDSSDPESTLDFSEGIIRKVSSEYCIYSKEGKNLGCYKTREAAVKRLHQIEFFKHSGFVKGDLVARESPDMVHYESSTASTREDNISAIEKHVVGTIDESIVANRSDD
jgi:hypothetical protein